ncbi:MAG: NnrS family protein [Verrucomicrobia bacterium]|nr:NnrS family protein [Verrucomicrobiota bacterium]
MNLPLAEPRQRVDLATVIDEPYRIFFPLGAFCSLLGVAFWIVKGWLPFMEEVSSKVHVWTQVYGFMSCFVFGFLTTALPRFTDTRRYRPAELLVLVGLLTASVVSVLRQDFFWGHVFYCAAIVLLLCTLLPRFMKRKHAPPMTFVFVPFALASALLGSGLLVAVSLGFHWRLAETIGLASGLLFEGFVIFLILGVGGFLIRSILGWLSMGPAHGEKRPDVAPAPRRLVVLHVSAALLLFASFFLEAYWNRSVGASLRALVVTLEAVWQMNIHRWPISGKMGSHWLRLAITFLLVGLWGDAVVVPHYPAYRLAILHICFVGGFSMTTLVVASRVILSHGGFSAVLKANHRLLSLSLVLIAIGLLARFAADFAPNSYTLHLRFAASLWCAGLLIWCGAILAKISLRPGQ